MARAVKNGSRCKIWAFPNLTFGKMGHTLKNGSKCEKLVAFGKMCHTVKNCSQLVKCVTLWKWVTFENKCVTLWKIGRIWINVSHCKTWKWHISKHWSLEKKSVKPRGLGHICEFDSDYEIWNTFQNVTHFLKFDPFSQCEPFFPLWPIFSTATFEKRVSLHKNGSHWEK